MTANNSTTARKPLEQVAESMEVILARIHGLVERDGKGVLVQTEKGKALLTLLSSTPSEKQDEVAMAFLFPSQAPEWNGFKGAGILKM